ncbi:MAG: hypothetical protein HUU20_28860 [Pirellulales bacterium]|nr:hypothetical protein [Pirellulales bacterium]
MDRLAALPPNWDGESASPIDPEIIEAARNLITGLPEDIGCGPVVVPSADGHVQFEWNAGPVALELEIESPEVVHFLQWHPEAGVEEEGFFGIDDVDRAASLVRWFTQGTANA